MRDLFGRQSRYERIRVAGSQCELGCRKVDAKDGILYRLDARQYYIDVIMIRRPHNFDRNHLGSGQFTVAICF